MNGTGSSANDSNTVSSTSTTSSGTSSTGESRLSLAELQAEFASKWRLLRACARCRRLKMKCSYENPSFKSCIRCHAASVDCSFEEDPTAKYAKKRRKKSETFRKSTPSQAPLSVRDKEVLGTSIPVNYDGLQQQHNSATSFDLDVMVRQSEQALNTLLGQDIASAQEKEQLQALLNNYRQISESLSEKLHHSDKSNAPLIQGNYPHISFHLNLIKQMIVTYKFFTVEEARNRFRFFIEHMLPYYPTIALSKDLKLFDNLYENFPLLLIACISVTAVNDNNLSIDHTKVSNSQLYNLLNHYLYSFISYQVYVKCEDFSIDLIYVCLILSCWCLPPNKMGQFRNQLNSLTAFNMGLCIDLGEISKFKDTMSLEDASVQRNDLRALLAIYCCCGSLELSLRRFKLVSWTKNHEAATELLMKPQGPDLPTREDRYLVYYSKFVSMAKEIIDFISPIAQNYSNLPSKTKPEECSIPGVTSHGIYLSPKQVKYVLNSYEKKLHQLLGESGFMRDCSDGEQEPKEKLVLSIMYHHLLTILYDNLISNLLHVHDDHRNNTSLFQGNEVEDCLHNIIKLLNICGNLMKCFMKLNSEHTVNYPTVLYYRPMHSLTLLVRLKLVLKSSRFANVEGIADVIKDIDIEKYFADISKIIVENQKVYNSVVCSKMMIILNKIEKWMKVSSAYNFNQKPTNGTSDLSLDLVKLISMSKDQEIESLDPPKDFLEKKKETSTAPEDSPIVYNQNSRLQSPDPAGADIVKTFSPSIEKIFEQIDADIMNYLNPLESYFNDFGGSMEMFDT